MRSGSVAEGGSAVGFSSCDFSSLGGVGRGEGLCVGVSPTLPVGEGVGGVAVSDEEGDCSVEVAAGGCSAPFSALVVG